MKEKVYPLEQIYVGRYQGKIKAVYLDEKLGYFNLSNRNSANHFNEKFSDNFETMTLLDEFLKKYGLDVLLIDKDGNKKQYLRIQEINYIMKITERKLLLSQSTLQKIHFASTHLSQIISDLLGLNVTVKPNSKYRFSDKLDISTVLVPAKKLEMFKGSLISFIEASLLSDDSAYFTYEVGNRDYRISRSLNNARIPQDGRIKQNIFSVSLDEKGKIAVNGKNIKDYFYEESFQKIIKF